MMKSPPLTLHQIAARLEDQALESAALRSALDIQFTRIAQMQAELDVMPGGRQQREALLTRVLQLHRHNGNGQQPHTRH
jgi:hypothetical protein